MYKHLFEAQKREYNIFSFIYMYLYCIYIIKYLKYNININTINYRENNYIYMIYVVWCVTYPNMDNLSN